MRNYLTAVLIAAFLIPLGACSSGRTPQVLPPASSPPNVPTASASRVLSAAAGGDIALRGGAGISLAPNVLRGDQRVNVDYASSVRETPPNPGWGVAKGELTVTIPNGTTRHTERITAQSRSPLTAPRGVVLRMPYDADDASAVEAARAPLVTIVDSHGSHRIVLDGVFDSVHHVVTVNVPRPMLDGSVIAVRLALGTNASQFHAMTAIQTGGRYWDDAAGAWTPNAQPLDPNARTLVMVHGLFSSVESAFGCAHDYTTAASAQPGAYAQIVGFDYDYTQPPSVEGPLLARFINGLGLTNYDIEAHSYGTLVTLGALPDVTLQPQRAVLVGGPLPLRGSPLVTSPWIRDILLTLAAYTLATPAQVDAALNSGMVDALGTDSAAMQRLRAQTWALPNRPRFDRVAGTKQYWEEDFFDWALYGTIDFPWDGVVETIAAESSGLPYVRQTEIPYQHVGLPCDAPTIDFTVSEQQ